MVAWEVHLFRPGIVDPIEGYTKNLSSEGLYCVVSQPVAVGDAVAYLLMVPAFGPGGGHEVIRLSGQLEVLRMEQVGAGSYGLGCQFRDYRVLVPEVPA